MSVAIVIPPYRVDSGMGGIGLRAWELAQVLGQRLPVTIVARSGSDLAAEGVRCVPVSEESWREAIDSCTAAIFYDMPDTRMMLWAHRAGKLVISENGVPIEHLHYQGIRSAKDPDAAYEDLVLRFHLQVLLSDHFILRSSVARSTLIASLSLVGRLGYFHFDRSPSLEHLFSWLPIGFNLHSAAHAESSPATMAPVDFVWSGGIWDFYEPVAVARAVARLALAGDPVTVRFMYMPPGDQILEEGARLAAAVRKLKIESLVNFHRPALPHYQRDGVVKSARAAVCIGKDGIENQTTVRLRLRDSFLYGLPIVIDRHGATGDLVRALGIGIAVDASDIDDIARGLAALKDPELHRRLTDNITRLRPQFSIDSHVDRLIEVVESARRAPDIGTERHRRLVEELLARHPKLEESPRYPF
jgi:glycosyltransferase involved in cell wall biosynthesis